LSLGLSPLRASVPLCLREIIFFRAFVSLCLCEIIFFRLFRASAPLRGRFFLRHCVIMKLMTNNKFIFIPILALALAFAACPSTPRRTPGKFSVDLSSPQFPAGEIETQIDRTFPLTGIRKIAVAVSYFPGDDAVCLRYRSDFFTYNQFWSPEGREAFLAALEKYNEDYATRDLDSGNRRSKSKYGVIEGFLAWQMQSFTRRVTANMNVELGYSFKDRAPYYAVTQKLTSYVDNISKENDMNSQEITMYFTRAQAQELAELFDPEYLRGLIPPELGGRRIDASSVEIDEY